ncbi:MAG: SirB1 family protein [Oculatellaceae cyanobacterium bins.114]|nr:SirB1 family protein [Oculatellaceae cyanobacterium bins.114]
MEFPLSRQRFYQEIHQSDNTIDLAKAALFFAQEEYPNLDPDDYLNALDTMADEVEERLPSTRYPLRVIQTINDYLYKDLGFNGNLEDYYDPRNSYLNQVIDRRVGIPITLSLVYLEIARRLDFPMAGVGMPGHFLIRPVAEEMEVFVDPFHGGEILFSEDCQERFSQVHGKTIRFDVNFLEPVTPRRFLGRMLTNLKVIYLNRGEWSKALAVIERLLLVFPEAPVEQRDRGILYYQMGRWVEATQDLENYLISAPMAEDAAIVKQLLKRMTET